MKSGDDYPPDSYNCRCVLPEHALSLDPPWFHPDQSLRCVVLSRLLGPRISSQRTSDPSNGVTYWWQCEHCGASGST